MIRLVTGDAPDIVALQEVPLWALHRLERWSGMTARSAKTMPALLGPLARLAVSVDPIRFRSMATGQANAILVNPRFEVGEHKTLVLNPYLSRRARMLKWKHRRLCQSLQVTARGRELVVGNLHAAPARDQIMLASEFLADAERCLLCGDFNLGKFEIAGFSTPIEGLDQIFARGLDFEQPPLAWPEERRRIDGRLLSDHAPIEAVIA
jgi:endonuclease/exonuclease/phosphatase family metal-dependent hydrolase